MKGKQKKAKKSSPKLYWACTEDRVPTPDSADIDDLPDLFCWTRSDGLVMYSEQRMTDWPKVRCVHGLSIPDVIAGCSSCDPRVPCPDHSWLFAEEGPIAAAAKAMRETI